jgi:hypothetical protein
MLTVFRRMLEFVGVVTGVRTERLMLSKTPRRYTTQAVPYASAHVLAHDMQSLVPQHRTHSLPSPFLPRPNRTRRVRVTAVVRISNRASSSSFTLCVSICVIRHVSIRQKTLRQYTSTYNSIRQHFQRTSVYRVPSPCVSVRPPSASVFLLLCGKASKWKFSSLLCSA